MASVLGACSFAPGSFIEPSTASTDAAIDALILGPWGAPTILSLPPPTDTDDDPTLTEDGLELYINTTRGGNADVYVSARGSTTAPWPEPVYVPLVSSTANETTPEVSADGLAMIVSSDRAGSFGGNDLWLSTRNARGDAWGMAERIDELCSTFNDTAGSMTPDKRVMVFSSTRINGAPDLFITKRDTDSSPWGPPVSLDAVNTPGHDGSPSLSADGLTLYLDTDRGGTLDIYMARRGTRDEDFGPAVPVTEVSSTTAFDADPWISVDGRRLVFQSNRDGTNRLWEAVR